MPITDWPIAERPREKLLKQSPHSLSDAELLAIFLRTGIKGKTAVDLARDLIYKFQGLRRIFEADISTFCEHQGLGIAKYVQLQACLEMGRRHLHAALQTSPLLDSFQKVSDFLISRLRHQQREIFSALFLNTKLCLIAYEELFMGTLSEITVHPREIAKKALQHNASSVIVAHNHPSGMVQPSREDIHLTEMLKSALILIDVKLIDHIIIGEGKAFSFAKEGLLN